MDTLTTTSSSAQPEVTPPTSLWDYWALLMRWKFLAAVVFVIVTATVVVGAFVIPPTYTAQTAIMLKHGREFYYRAAAGTERGGSVFSLEEMVNTEVEILNSRDLTEHVIRELGVQQVYPDMLEDPDADLPAVFAAAVSRLRDSIVVADVLESSVIRITLDHGDPAVAADALNLFIERFKDKHVEIFSEPKAGFIAGQLAAYEARLGASVEAFGAFRQQHGIYDLAAQKSLLLGQQVELDTALNTTEFRISELEQQLAFLNGKSTSEEAVAPPPYPTEDRASLVTRRGALGSVLQEVEMRLAELRQQLLVSRDRSYAEGDAVAPMPGMENYRSIDEAFIRLLDLKLQEKELLGNYKETSRQVIGIRSEIATVEDFLRQRGAYFKSVIEVTLRDEVEGLMARRSAALEQIERMDAVIHAFDVRQAHDVLAPLQARRERIRQELGALNEEIRSLDENEQDYRELERRVALDERNYQAFMDVSEEARIMEELDRQKMVNIAVIERASAPLQPSSLSVKLRIVLGALVGLLAGAAAAVFMGLIRA